MNTFNFNADEQEAAAAISTIRSSTTGSPGLGLEKRGRDDGADHAAGMVVRPTKMARPSEAPQPASEAPRTLNGKELRPAPYFYYRDQSMETDPDPLTPLTPPGRVPNFPAKMHAILSRKDLQDIVAWLPHGRSWRVLKPREFEIKVIPKFFEHAKFSSFVRQANGWGFRRITQGKDRNSYYHEKFLRGLPHLCKTMKRPGVNEKKQADPEHEPDLYKISEENPVPEKADDDSIMLHSTLQGGPKARMPIYWGSAMGAAPGVEQAPNCNVTLAPNDHAALQAFQHSMVASEAQVAQKPAPTAQPMQVSPGASPGHGKLMFQVPTFMPSVPVPTPATAAPTAPTMQMAPQPNGMAALAAANQMAAFQAMPGMNAAAASQFAAGFAAATAFSQQHFSTVLGSLAAQKSMQEQFQQSMPQPQMAMPQQQMAMPQQQQQMTMPQHHQQQPQMAMPQYEQPQMPQQQMAMPPQQQQMAMPQYEQPQMPQQQPQMTMAQMPQPVAQYPQQQL